jgi:hypothetical protein
MQPQLYLNALFTIKRREDEYHKMMKQMRKLQGDAFTYVQPVDDLVLESVVNAFNDVFLSLTGLPELASHFLFESPNSGVIKTTDGKVIWVGEHGFEESVYSLISSNEVKKRERERKDSTLSCDKITTSVLYEALSEFKTVLLSEIRTVVHSPKDKWY